MLHSNFLTRASCILTVIWSFQFCLFSSFFFNIQYSLFIRIHRAWQIFPTKSVRLFFRVYSLFEHLHAPWVEGNYKSQKKISWMQTIRALKILVVHLWKFIYKKHDFLVNVLLSQQKLRNCSKNFNWVFFHLFLI